jgi:4-amino-4-deoxychorismate synthase (2-amino-4-deoxychorismate-forming) component I
VPHLPRPLILLEDGRGLTGRARLAWGARARHRLDWSQGGIGSLGWLTTLPADRRLYGTLAYDLGLPPHARRAEPLVPQPLADFFVPEHELVVDCGTAEVLAGEWAELDDAAERRNGTSRQPRGSSHGTASLPPSRPPVLRHRSFTQSAFEAAVRQVKERIAAGDVYQVNLAVGDRYETALTPWELYLRLRAVNPSPWMGFADFGDWQIASGSPELLIEVGGTDGGTPPVIRTRPIAGTRKKTGDRERDAAMRAELTLDAKERAEHRMLLDLARNDVGRVAEFGSVHVAEREVVEEYSHVFHLVSDVVGLLRADRTAADAVTALFPGGTITGAPKIRAMEVIAQLEPVARGAYTGGLGWLGPDGAQLNILIRSAVFREGAAGIHAGAGIVWDSDPAREWRESLRKAAALRVALGAEG